MQSEQNRIGKLKNLIKKIVSLEVDFRFCPSSSQQKQTTTTDDMTTSTTNDICFYIYVYGIIFVFKIRDVRMRWIRENEKEKARIENIGIKSSLFLY